MQPERRSSVDSKGTVYIPVPFFVYLGAFGLHSKLRNIMAVPPELIEILRCPKCRSTVELKPDNSALKCTNAECSLVYPIKDDIPVMLVEEATVEK